MLRRRVNFVTKKRNTGATYYVDGAAGNDANAGTQAAPWKTPYYASQQSLNPGDTVCFKAGQTFTCTEGSAATVRTAKILCASSGTAAAPITYTRYGAGADPILDSVVYRTDWTVHSGACYKRTETDTDFGAPTGSDNTSGTYKYSVWEGMTRYSFAASLAACISTAGTWFGASNVIYVHCFADANPNTLGTVGYANGTLSHTVNTNGKNYITFDHIEARRAKASGFFVGANGTLGIKFTSCTGSWNGQRGFRLDYDGVDGLQNCSLINCTAFDNMAEGIWINGTNMLVQGCEVYNGKKDFAKKLGNTADAGGILVGVYANGVTVRNCYVHDCYFNGYLWMEWESGFGEPSRPKNCVFDTNHILVNINQSTGGKLGVVIQGDNTCVVKNNWIESTSAHTGNTVTLNNGISGALIYHNTIIGNAAGFIVATGDGTSSVTLKNNIIRNLHATAGENTYIGTSCTATIAGNCFSSKADGTGFYAMKGVTSQSWAQFVTMYGAPGINALPLFVTEGTNYHLQAGSPCRNVGENLGITPDYDGVARDTTPDIGAFEYA